MEAVCGVGAACGDVVAGASTPRQISRDPREPAPEKDGADDMAGKWEVPSIDAECGVLRGVGEDVAAASGADRRRRGGVSAPAPPRLSRDAAADASPAPDDNELPPPPASEPTGEGGSGEKAGDVVDTPSSACRKMPSEEPPAAAAAARRAAYGSAPQLGLSMPVADKEKSENKNWAVGLVLGLSFLSINLFLSLIYLLLKI